MDRFIASISVTTKLYIINLKSSMDRFIVAGKSEKAVNSII